MRGSDGLPSLERSPGSAGGVKTNSLDLKRLVLLSGLAMSVGWGFRGDYGHEAGAMVPGALLGLAVALASGREDWARRAPLLGFLGAIGWAFGGQMSYGKVVGYTAHTSLPDVAYGYACLFAIGALWGGIGAGILALGVTRPRGELNRFAGPLGALFLVWIALDLSELTDSLSGRWSLNDSDWVAAASALLVAWTYGLIAPAARPASRLILLLAGGWWLGFLLFPCLLGRRMTPPRSDNWAGCAGLYGGLVAHFLLTRNRAALALSLTGLLWGGAGFVAGDFVNILGRAGWGPIGASETLRALDHWKWMEQLFGLAMGAGVALGFARVLRGRIAPPQEDSAGGALDSLATPFLLVVMLWMNLYKNVRNWSRDGHIAQGLFGLAPSSLFLAVGIALSAVVAAAWILHHRRPLPLAPRSQFGRGQLLFLLLLWIAVIAALLQAFPGLKSAGVLFVHATFWLTAAACSLLLLLLREPQAVPEGEMVPPENRRWLPDWRHAVLWALVPLLILLVAWLSTSTHAEPLQGSHLRFGE